MPDEGQNSKSTDTLNRMLVLLDGLSEDERSRVIKAVVMYYGVGVGKEPGAVEERLTRDNPRVGFSEDLAISPKEFLIEKQPRTDVERMASLAFYLAHYRDMPFFKTVDLSKLNTEAAQPKFSNAAVTSNNALKMGYLASASKGARQLSAAGEQFVRALPDREKARSVMDSLHRRKRSRKSTPAQESAIVP
jgi:hypothetical protein